MHSHYLSNIEITKLILAYIFMNIQALIKEPKPTGLKKHSAAVEKFLEELSSFGKDHNPNNIYGHFNTY